MANYTARFEVVNNLYYARHRRLRPGKSEAVELGRDSGSHENRTLFENWYTTEAFMQAIDKIVELEELLEKAKQEAWGPQA